MKFRFPSIFASLVLVLFVNACLEAPEVNADPSDGEENFGQLDVPSNFSYQTTRTLSFVIETEESLPDVPLRLYYQNPELGGEYIQRGFTDASGEANFSLEIPIHIDSLYVAADYIGIPDLYKINLGDQIDQRFVIGENPGDQVFSVQGISYTIPSQDPSILRLASSSSVRFKYKGSYRDNGRPNYLTSNRFGFSTDALNRVNASLPNRSSVESHHPSYFSESAETDIKLTDSSEVYMTFLHEGAGLKSSIGYYTYDLNDPPESPDDIDDHNIVFPNCSYNNSGGGLARGSRVRLGRFAGNRGIGFFMVPDGWDPISRIVTQRTNYNRRMKYSNPNFNSYAPSGKRRHQVIINDPDRELFFVGMEDISRPNGDEDCNDAVFALEATKYSAVDKTNMETVEEAIVDADNDGIADAYDEFPNDAELAYTSHTPSEDHNGTLLFEDQWPKLGDFDMNDMVIGYNYEYELNSKREVKNIIATFKLVAQGGIFKNGFGIELDIPPSSVSSVTGSQLSEGIVTLSANGTESGQSKAVIIAFDNGKAVIGKPSAGIVNTDPEESQENPVEVSIRIELTSAIAESELGTAPFNPFIFTDLRRGYEVHLADNAPTDLADNSLFGTEDDDSDLAGGTKYYKNPVQCHVGPTRPIRDWASHRKNAHF